MQVEAGTFQNVKNNQKLDDKVNSMVFDLLRRMFAAFHLPWRELTKENMYEKADQLKKVKKNDCINMKRIPTSIEALFEESKVKKYRSKLEEMIARRRDNSKLNKESGMRGVDDNPN